MKEGFKPEPSFNSFTLKLFMMKNYFKYLAVLCGFVFYSPGVIAQNPFDQPATGPGTPAARILAEITLDGAPLQNVDYVAARETDFGNVAGTGLVFVAAGGPFAGKSFINITIFGDEGVANQLSENECFTFEIYDDSADEFLIVSTEPNPCDLRFCDNSGCPLEKSSDYVIRISSSSEAQREGPAMFGGFVNQGGVSNPMPNWEQGDVQPGGNLEILPVSYSSMSLSNNDCESVSFSWTTETETNNEGFVVQRKVDEYRDWEDLDFIPGNGTSVREIDYNYTDEQITEDKSVQVAYYRLKQIDRNGLFEYSDTKAVRLNCGNQTYINVFPSPAYDVANVELTHEGLKDNEVSFEIMNIHGQVVQRIIQSVSNRDQVELNISEFNAGVYYIQARLENGQVLSRNSFVKI